MARKNARSVDGEALHRLIANDNGTEIVRARLEWANADGFRKFVAKLATKQRVYPEFLPTQRTGRWSVKEPPLTGFPDDAKAKKKGLPALRRCVIPDPGWYWLCGDYDAMHAKFMACASNDQDDLRAFRENLDIHTMTMCRVFKVPLPPVLTKALFVDEACRLWREEHQYVSSGDRRRHLMKTLRYALLNAYDEKGVLESKDVEELGLKMIELLNYARQYLRAKPGMVEFKKRFCDDAIKRGIARSVYGRRRIIRGSDYKTMFKLSISQWLQGTEVDILEDTLIQTTDRFPECRLVYPSHDGFKFAFPESIPLEESFPIVRAIAEQEREIYGNVLAYTCEWEAIRGAGRHEKFNPDVNEWREAA